MNEKSRSRVTQGVLSRTENGCVDRLSATDLKTRRMMHACSLERGLTYKGGAEVKLALNTYPGSDAKVCVALLNNSGEHAVTAVR